VITVLFPLVPSMDSAEDPEPTLVVRLTVGMDIAWDMLPYPSARRSVVTRQAFLDARARLGDHARHGRGLLLTGLRIFDQSVPDLIVLPSAAPGRLQGDGFLGLDFFEQFDVVEWRPKSRQMRLIVE
jgi:hypothetical protein